MVQPIGTVHSAIQLVEYTTGCSVTFSEALFLLISFAWQGYGGVAIALCTRVLKYLMSECSTSWHRHGYASLVPMHMP